MFDHVNAYAFRTGPLVGGYLSSLGWRWLYWIQLIIGGAAYILICFIPETYAPKILARRAAKLRKETGDDKYQSESDLDKRPVGERMRIFVVRPFQLLFQELIVFLISLYMVSAATINACCNILTDT